MQNMMNNSFGTVKIPVSQQIQNRVDVRDRNALVNAYLKMFSGASWVRWTNGDSVGRAWQGALEMCGAVIGTKQKSNNLAAQYLSNVYAAHKKMCSKVIMTNRYSDTHIDMANEKRMEKQAHGKKLLGEGLAEINLILARYNEMTEEKIDVRATKSVKPAVGAVKQQPTPQRVVANAAVNSVPNDVQMPRGKMQNNSQYVAWILALLLYFLNQRATTVMGGQKRAKMAVNHAGVAGRVRPYVPQRSSMQSAPKPMAQPEQSDMPVVVRVKNVNVQQQMVAAKKRVMQMSVNLQQDVLMRMLNNKRQNVA